MVVDIYYHLDLGIACPLTVKFQSIVRLLSHFKGQTKWGPSLFVYAWYPELLCRCSPLGLVTCMAFSERSVAEFCVSNFTSFSPDGQLPQHSRVCLPFICCVALSTIMSRCAFSIDHCHCTSHGSHSFSDCLCVICGTIWICCSSFGAWLTTCHLNYVSSFSGVVQQRLCDYQFIEKIAGKILLTHKVSTLKLYQSH